MPGTCSWLIYEPEIQSWLEETAESRIVWFSAPPGSGKSVLSSYIISYLRESGKLCQYFFFKFNEQGKSSLLDLSQSIVVQVARDIPIFQRALIDLSAEGLTLQNAQFRFVWQKIFETVLFKLRLSRPLYWVIDALDESESSDTLLDMLRSLRGSLTHLRILIVSRRTDRLSRAFNRLSDFVPVAMINKDGQDHNYNDIHFVVEKGIKHMHGGNKLKERVTREIMERAEGNFL